MTPVIRLTPRRLGATLVAVIALLVVAHVVVRIARTVLHGNDGYGFFRLFELHAEANVPTVYETTAILACAALLGIIASMKRAGRDPFAGRWLLLALVFVYLGLDEGSEIHELFTRVARYLAGGATVMHFDWLLIGAPLLVVFLIAHLRFLLHLAPAHRYRFIASGFVYVLGAVGMELAGGVVADRYGIASGLYFAMVTAEETLEMLGIAGFLLTLLIYLREQAPPIRIDLA